MVPPQGDLVLYRFILQVYSKYLRNLPSHEPLARMLFKLAWNILGARRFKFVQMKCPGSEMALPPERGQKEETNLKIF